MAEITTAIIIVAGAIVFGLHGYFSKVLKDPETEWDTRKFLILIITSVIVGAYAFYEGVTLTPDNYWTIAQTIGAPVIADRLFRSIWRLLRYLGVVNKFPVIGG